MIDAMHKELPEIALNNATCSELSTTFEEAVTINVVLSW